jgi:class 3 adenylate cyclase
MVELPESKYEQTPAIESPQTRYARSGEINIAYQVVGEGDLDVVYVPPGVSNVALIWSMPREGPLLRELSRFARVTVFDKRGTGMSDRVAGAPSLEMRMDDLRAVMDAASLPRAAIFAIGEGAPMSILFAATYPERTTALVLLGGFARTLWGPHYPFGVSEQDYRAETEADLGVWFGTREQAVADILSRTSGGAVEEVRRSVDYYRQSASPGAVQALAEMNKEIDVDNVLAAIRVPTLVAHGTNDASVKLEAGRHLAERIPTARFLELTGTGRFPTGEAATAFMNAVKDFLTQANKDDTTPEETMLATVLFTDIVGSTVLAAELGDRRWRELLERHNEVVRAQLANFGGREIDTAGDGFFATFDGPARAIRCACAITDAMRELGVELRAGLHTGECELVDGKVGGIAVHIGARLVSVAEPGEVLVSSTVKDLVAGSRIEFKDRGKHELKGISEAWHLYTVVP